MTTWIMVVLLVMVAVWAALWMWRTYRMQGQLVRMAEASIRIQLAQTEASDVQLEAE
jgi:hypothetical protein